MVERRWRNQACHAADLIRRLSPEGLAVLGACVGRKKSGSNRLMRASDLEDNIGPTLRSRGVAVDMVVRELQNFEPRLLSKHGSGSFAATADGEVIKHVFDDLKNELVLHRVPRAALLVPESYDCLLMLMRVVCDEPATPARVLADRWDRDCRRQ